jgi:dienelactone hydrolase
MNRRVVTPLSAEPGSQPHAAAGQPNAFDYDLAPPVPDNHDIEVREGYEVKLLSFRSVGENGQEGNLVTGHYYRALEEGPRPLVIILPIWGSKHTYPSRKMNRYLRRHSEGRWNVLMLHGERRLVSFEEMSAAEDAETFRATTARMAERCRDTAIDTRRLIDWAENRSEIDPERIALIGFSVGGIVAADVALVDARLAATVIIMGSARPGEVVAGPAERSGVARQIITDRFGWSEARYVEEVSALFDHLDPVRFAGGVDPRRVLLFDAARDERMTRGARDDLWEALGRPERITLQYRHEKAFYSMTPLGNNYTTRRVWKFLKEWL